MIYNVRAESKLGPSDRVGGHIPVWRLRLGRGGIDPVGEAALWAALRQSPGRPDGPAATRACAEPLVRTHKHEDQRLSSSRPACPSPPRPPARGRCQRPRERATWRPCGPMARVGPYDLRRR